MKIGFWKNSEFCTIPRCNVNKKEKTETQMENQMVTQKRKPTRIGLQLYWKKGTSLQLKKKIRTAFLKNITRGLNMFHLRRIFVSV